MPGPRFTVIIPTYNWSTVLPFSIRSVLEQSLTDLELLVIGDCCTDDSSEVVAAFRDPRVQWVNLPQRSGHQSGPNNEGLRRATGEFIAYLGHDDLWLPHHLQSMAAALASSDLAHTIVASIRRDGTIRPPVIATEYVEGLWIPPTGTAHRRAVTEAIGGWRHFRDVSDAPEVELLQRAHRSGFRSKFVPRLTAIKFPAAGRKDVYRERPFHEQQIWSARIRSEPDLEATLLGAMVETFCRDPSKQRYSTLVRDLVKESRRRLQARLQRMIQHRSSETLIEKRQRFKGVDVVS